MRRVSQRKIIWFGITMSTFAYAVVLYSVAQNWPQPGSFDAAVRRPITLGLYGAALLIFTQAFVLPRGIKDHHWRFVVTLAMFEACALFGLTAAFMNQDWRLFIAPWVLALMGFVRTYPSE